MKRFIQTQQLGGMPFKNNDFIDVIQNGGFNLLKGMFSNWRRDTIEGCVVSGCEVTDAGGGTLNVAEGVVFLDEDFYFVPATSVTLSGAEAAYIIPSTDTIESRVFKDGISKDVFLTKNATVTVAFGPPPISSGQFVTFRDAGQINDWKSLTSLFGALSPNWIELSPLIVRKNINGYIEFQGKLNSSSATSSDILFGTLPRDYKPRSLSASSIRSTNIGATDLYAFNVNTAGLSSSSEIFGTIGVSEFFVELSYLSAEKQ